MLITDQGNVDVRFNRKKVIAAIAKSQSVSVEQLNLNTTFEEIGMTSLDSLALIFDLEEEFNISIPNEDAMGCAP